MRMNEFEYVQAKDAVSATPELDLSGSADEVTESNAKFREDMLLVINSLNVAVIHLKTLMQLLVDDDGDLCGEHYKASRDNGLTL